MMSESEAPVEVPAGAETAAAAQVEPSIFDSPAWTGEAETSAALSTDNGFVGIRFQRVGKTYHYLSGGLPLKVGNWVIVDTPRGKQMGQVATLKPPKNRGEGPFKRVERLATGRDMAMRHYYESRELEALIACRAESNALGLPIKIVRAEYSFDGQTLTFLYSTEEEERIETGELRQAMSRLYRARVELRQISPREVAKILGGLGACGIEERCCSRFLTEFSPISIKHAKEQNLSLNPHDITGMCGRLRCCLIYEYEQYVEARRHLPKRNAIVGTPMGEAKVIEVLPMRDSVVVRVGEAEAAKEFEFHREQLVPLEEFKRLQDKALSGACDKHGNGPCDCGKDKQTGVAQLEAEAPSRPAPQATPPTGTRSKKRRKKKAASPSPTSPEPTSVTSAPRRDSPAAGGLAQDEPSVTRDLTPDSPQRRKLRRPLRARRTGASASGGQPTTPAPPAPQS